MEGKYTFEQFNEDLNNGYKVLYDYVRNRYMVYKVNEDCYMIELVEQKSRNPVFLQIWNINLIVQNSNIHLPLLGII